MAEEGLVSVLTPAYNGEAYIPRLPDFVLDQTYPRIEMLVADDGMGTSLVMLRSEQGITLWEGLRNRFRHLGLKEIRRSLHGGKHM